MKRYFNTTGYCRPDWHYMIDPLKNIKSEIDELIEKKQYFLIHAPRQTGKTTLLHALAKQINKEGKYICVVFSIENAGYKDIDVKDAMFSYIYLKNWCQQQNKLIVLLIDEIDSVWDDVLIATLRQLRNGFQLRPNSFPISLALVGLRDIRDYKMKIKKQNGALGSGSPFNIKAKSFRLGTFSKNQIAESKEYLPEALFRKNDLTTTYNTPLTWG